MLTWDSRSSSSCILSLIESMSMEGWSGIAEAAVDCGDSDGVTLAVLRPGAGAGAGAIVTGWPGSWCGVASYTHTAFLERTQLLQGVSLLHFILRCLHNAHEPSGY